MKKEAAGSSKTLMPVYQAVSYHTPEDHNFFVHHYDTVKSH